MTDTLDTQTVAAVVERKKLQRHFGRFDILFFLICTIVGVDTIATVAQGGGQAFTWMMIFAVVFFVPQARLFAELGSAFPRDRGAQARAGRAQLTAGGGAVAGSRASWPGPATTGVRGPGSLVPVTAARA
jgi:hypothetical protein